MSVQSPLRELSGKLVALEGDVDVVATQLRLLPPSQKILVLPALTNEVPHDLDPQDFNARTCIRSAHEAFEEQTERARSFLQSSTTTQPRLVFINGGSVRARATCITKICENITNGDVEEAEIIFNETVKDGVAGLMEDEDTGVEEVESDGKEEQDATGEETAQETPQKVEDPSLKAMKAAESLDRETAELQEAANEGHTLISNDASKATVTEAQAETPEVRGKFPNGGTGDDIVRTVVTVPSRAEALRENRSTLSLGRPPSTNNLRDSMVSHDLPHSQQRKDINGYNGNYERPQDLLSPGIYSPCSVASTPAVVFGEARVVEFQPTPKKTTRKVKSVDKFYPSNAGYADLSPSPNCLVKHAKSAYPLGQPGTSGSKTQGDHNDDDFPTLPKTSFVRASMTMIKKSSIYGGSLSCPSSSVSTPKARVYIDRGTNPEDVPAKELPEEAAPFEPVFPVVEDLVIHFAQNDPHDIFEHVLSSYKSGSYPIFPMKEPESSTIQECPLNGEEPPLQPISPMTIETDNDEILQLDEFDPYSTNNYSGGAKPRLRKNPPEENSSQALNPPGSSLTPPPSARGFAEKLCEFSPVNPNSVIGIQNSLRSLLNQHLPAGEHGYTQYYYPVSPETERLWKPVFRNEDTSSIGNAGRNLDLIIALGCEEGVKTEFLFQVSGQIEKLGMKEDGLNRSSKIDLRYLIANAMQTQTSVSLSNKHTRNSVTSPEFLATSIVPHLEAYLAINISTRLLILQYSSDHLATIFALRKILGQDVLKIAGIMNSTSSDPASLINHRRIPNLNPQSVESTSKQMRLPHSRFSDLSQAKNSTKSKRAEPGVSFSKANFLLPSTATDTEISTFLTGILTSLIEISPSYTPPPKPQPTIIETPPLPPSPATSTFSPHETSLSPASYRDGSMTRESKIARLTGNAGLTSSAPRTPTVGKGPKYAASIASTVRTTTTERFRREEARSEKEWENFYVGEVDSEDDDYDRMVLGRSLASIVPEVTVIMQDGKPAKRSTQKALKCLGLA